MIISTVSMISIETDDKRGVKCVAGGNQLYYR